MEVSASQSGKGESGNDIIIVFKNEAAATYEQGDGEV